MKNLKLIAVAAIVALSACNEKKENNETGSSETQTETSATKKEHEGVFKEYIELKDALVKTDAAEAKSEASELAGELAKLPESNADAQTVLNHSKHIASTDNIDEQRKAFAALSESFISLAKSGAVGKNEFYIQYCPMALDNKGAEWISDEEKIRNPYFGDEMMSCGEVKETVK